MVSVAEVFESMAYGPAPESAAPAVEWLSTHGPALQLHIDGAAVAPQTHDYFDSVDPATGRVLIKVAQGGAEDIDAAVAAARRAFAEWSRTPGHVRARHLYALARQVQRHARLLAVLETLDNGKPIRESRDIDIPLVARHLYHHAGWAQLMREELPDSAPLGVVGAIIPWNFPLLMLAWKVAPALAMGNTVVLKPAEFTSLTAHLFAELATAAGLPPGVLNVVSGDGRTGDLLVRHPGVDKIAFTGSTEVGRLIRRATAGTGKRLSLELGGKSPFIVFDDADLDSVVEGVVDAIWFNQGQVCCAGSRLLIQENIAERLLGRLRTRMERLRVGNPLDKAIDIGAIIAPVQLQRIERLVAQGRAEGAELWQPSWACPADGLFYPPTLLTNVAPASTVAQEEIFGPVVVAMTFRTRAEAVALANNTAYGLAASVWSENVNRALEVARAVKAGTVWVNCTNLFDAAAGFGGYRESGFGREGGREGLDEYVQPRWMVAGPGVFPTHAIARNRATNGHKGGDHANGAPAHGDGSNGNGAATGGVSEGTYTGDDHSDLTQILAMGDDRDRDSEESAPREGAYPPLDRTAKLFIGGKQARPDSGYARTIRSAEGRVLGEVGDGNRKDLRNAVEAAHAVSSWASTTAHGRAQILYYIAENLSARSDEFARRLTEMSAATLAEGSAEVEATIERLFTYAAWADKFDGAVHETPLRGVTLALHEPLGVLGIVCGDRAPLLGFVSLVAPAVAMGNTVVVVPSERSPLVATDLYQVLETSDLPPGVINIVTGQCDPLAAVLAAHDDVAALWYEGSADGARAVELASAGNLKRTWIVDRPQRDWFDTQQGQGRAFLHAATQVKNIWVPTGD